MKENAIRFVDRETSALLVYHNDSGEVFVEHKKSKYTLRIIDYCDDIIITADNCILTPANVNGAMGVKTYPKSTKPRRADLMTCDKCGGILYPPGYKCNTCESSY